MNKVWIVRYRHESDPRGQSSFDGVYSCEAAAEAQRDEIMSNQGYKAYVREAEVRDE